MNINLKYRKGEITRESSSCQGTVGQGALLCQEQWHPLQDRAWQAGHIPLPHLWASSISLWMG